MFSLKHQISLYDCLKRCTAQNTIYNKFKAIKILNGTVDKIVKPYHAHKKVVTGCLQYLSYKLGLQISIRNVISISRKFISW